MRQYILERRLRVNDSVLGAVSQLKANGTTIAGIVLELVDSEFSYMEIAKIFSQLGHFVALGPGSAELKGEMLISDEPGSPVVNSTATAISWGHSGTREDELPFRNHPEEVLVKDLLKKGVPCHAGDHREAYGGRPHGFRAARPVRAARPPRLWRWVRGARGVDAHRIPPRGSNG